MRLRDVCQILSGGTPSKANPSFWGGTVPWATARDLKQFDLERSKYALTEEGARHTVIAPTGSVLVLVRGMQLLKSFPVSVLGVAAAFNQDLRALIPREIIRGRYLAWQLRAHESQILKSVDIAGHGTGRLSGDLLRDMRVMVPNVEAQDRIVSILDSLEAAERAANGLVVAKQQFKLALMEELFSGRRRFPEFQSIAWRDIRLGEVFHERNESARPDLPLLSITGGRGVIARGDLVRRDSSAADKSAYKRIAPGDIGYNTMRMWQGVSGRSSLEGIVSPAYTVVVPQNGSILATYAAHLFKTPRIIDRFRRFSQGLVDDTLNLKYPAFAQIRVSLPNVKEQARIAETLDAADAEIEVLTRLRCELDLQRVCLMDRLFATAATG